MGIHNEPGMEVAPLTTSKKLLEDLIDMATKSACFLLHLDLVNSRASG
jgi:dihydroxyacetone kinase